MINRINIVLKSAIAIFLCKDNKNYCSLKGGGKPCPYYTSYIAIPPDSLLSAPHFFLHTPYYFFTTFNALTKAHELQ
jgi:hypothetical protein